MAWPISWDDDTVADASLLSSNSNWNEYTNGTCNQQSDEHDAHNFGAAGGQVMDGDSAHGEASYAFWATDIEPGTAIKLSSYVWPDAWVNSGLGRPAVGLLMRMFSANPANDNQVDGYAVVIRAGDDAVDADDDFLLEIWEITDEVQSVLASKDGLTTGVWSGSKTAMLLEVELENDGSGHPSFTVSVDGTTELTYTDTADNYTAAGYSGRYLGRFVSNIDAQPFTEDFTAEELGSGGQAITPTGASVTVTPGSLTVVEDQQVAPVGPSVVVVPGTVTVVEDQAITPVGASVVVTAGTLEVTRTQAITPDGATVVVTPGSPTVVEDQQVTPTGPTITVVPGSPTVVEDQQVAPVGASVTITAGTVTVELGGGTQAITPAGVSVSVTPGTPSLDQAISPTGASVTVTPGSATILQGISIAPDGATISVTPGTATITTGAVDITPAGASVTVTPGSLSFSSATPIAPTGATVTLTPGELGVDMAITPSGALVSVTPGAISIAFDQSVTLTGATVTVTPGVGNVYDSTNLAVDVRIVATYREDAFAAPYREDAYADTYQERAYAATYKGE